MLEPSATTLQTRREALSFVLSQARVAVWSTWLLMASVVWMGWQAGARAACVVVAACSLVAGLWRLQIQRATGDVRTFDAPALDRLEWRVQANMLLSGLMWGGATWTIYPHLNGDGNGGAAALFLALLVSITCFTAFAMSSVGHSFSLLVVPMLGSLVAVSLGKGDAVSVVTGLLSAVYLVLMTHTSRNFGRITRLSFSRAFEAQQANADLRQAMTEVDAAAQAKSRWLATMSHELRTPLHGLIGSLELMHQGTLDSAQQRLLAVARSSGGGLLRVLNDVLDYAKIDADQLGLRLEPMAPRALADEVVALFAAAAQAKGLSLSSQVAAPVPAWVVADVQRLRQVLQNLVDNAIKFSQHGQVVLHIDRVAAGLRLAVRDSGAGIAPELQRDLFEPFHQGRQGPAAVQAGSGLGLAISQRLVQAMGGRIEVDSQLGRGSSFAFTLDLPSAAAWAALDDNAATPCPPSALTTGETLTRPASAAAQPGRRGRVLLVDDNQVNRCIGVEMLGLLGLQVVEADDGQQALDCLHRQPFDLVLMDVQMPGKDGYQATREWRAHEAAQGRMRLPIVALTANVLAEDVERSLASGMDAWLGKPYDTAELDAVLGRWLPAT